MSRQEEMLPLSPLTMAILLALADGERHGYALMKEIEAQTDGTLRPGTGSLYAGLQRLLSDGLIREAEPTEEADRRRRSYAITQSGREMVSAEARRMMRVIEVASRRDLAPRPDPVPDAS